MIGYTTKQNTIIKTTLTLVLIAIVLQVEAQQAPVTTPLMTTTTTTTTTSARPTQQQQQQQPNAQAVTAWPMQSTQSPKTPNVIVIKTSNLSRLPTTVVASRQSQQWPTTTTTTSSTTKYPHQHEHQPLAADSDSDSKLWPFPVVNVDKHENKSKVDVHIPIVFDMTKDDNSGAGKSKLDLSVLSGLVTVNQDKSRQPNGLIAGPLTVTVFGIPVYNGFASSRLSRLLDVMGSSRNSFGQQQQPAERRPEQGQNGAGNKIVSSRIASSGRSSSSLGDLAHSGSKKKDSIIVNSITTEEIPTTRMYTDELRKSNERVLQTISGTLDKVASFVRQHAEPVKNVNGKPADKSYGFVKPSTFTESDLMPKIVPTFIMKKENVAHESHVYV